FRRTQRSALQIGPHRWRARLRAGLTMSLIQEVAPLLRRDRQRDALHYFQEVLPDQALRAVGLVPEDVAWVVRHHQWLAAELAPLPADISQRLERAESEQSLRGR